MEKIGIDPEEEKELLDLGKYYSKRSRQSLRNGEERFRKEADIGTVIRRK